mmetsp:Transcript_20251/g.47284  ORF Transcript_20251/g.47284 Transcript_20251/m.47284 type:complete len:330 (-) Transcript_20251:132-1121(-)
MISEEGSFPEGEEGASSPSSSKAEVSPLHKGKKRLPPLESRHKTPDQGFRHRTDLPGLPLPTTDPSRATSMPQIGEAREAVFGAGGAESPLARKSTADDEDSSDGEGQAFTFGTTNPVELPVVKDAPAAQPTSPKAKEEPAPARRASPPSPVLERIAQSEEALKVPPSPSMNQTIAAPPPMAGASLSSLQTTCSAGWDTGNAAAVPYLVPQDQMGAGLPAVPQHTWPQWQPDVYAMQQQPEAYAVPQSPYAANVAQATEDQALRYSASKGDYMAAPEWPETQKQSYPVELPDQGGGIRLTLSPKCMACGLLTFIVAGGGAMLAMTAVDM